MSDIILDFFSHFNVDKVGPLAAHYQVPLRHILLVCIFMPFPWHSSKLTAFEVIVDSFTCMFVGCAHVDL